MSKGHNELLMALLPSQLVIKKFVNNMPESNYELFLTDYLNASTYFMKKTHGEAFIYQEDQSNGQCDCYSDSGDTKIGIDFKLFGSQKGFQAKSILSQQITQVCPGSYAFSPSKEKGTITGTWILSALEDKSLGDLEAIAACPDPSVFTDVIDSDIYSVLKTLVVSKNLFLFLGYRFLFPADYQFDEEEELSDLVSSLSDRLKAIIAYREKQVGTYETFFSFIFEDKLIMTIFQEGKLVLIDKVPLTASTIFIDLNSLSFPNETIRIKS